MFQSVDAGKQSAHRNVRIFVLYRAVSRLYFYLPILVVFFLASGQNYLQIGVLLASYSLIVGLLEVPAGALADRFGYKALIIAGELFKAAGLAGLAYAGNFIELLAGQVLCGLGYVAASGADSALLYRSLGNQDLYTRIETRSHSVVLASILVSGVVGGIVAHYFGPGGAVVISIPAALSAVLISAGFSTVPVRAPGEKLSAARLSIASILWRNPVLFRHFLNYGVTRAVLMAVFVAYLPVVYFVETRVPLHVFGVLLGSYTLVSILCSRNHARIVVRLGEHGAMLAAYLSLGLAVLLITVPTSIEWLVYGAPMLLGYAAGVTRPIAMSVFNALCEDDHRARLLSAAEAACAIITVILIVSVNALIHFKGVRTGLAGLAFLVLALLAPATSHVLSDRRRALLSE